MPSASAFDELYVISDLHLGGEPGFQIFKQGNEARRLLEYLRQRPAGLRVCLVINGDLVDFLAEPGATYFDPLGAGAKLDRIVHDPAFSPVFDGLREFVATPNTSLVITLGNHDLELALPWVREQLLQELCRDDPAARGRITLAFDGTGFRCEVGSCAGGASRRRSCASTATRSTRGTSPTSRPFAGSAATHPADRRGGRGCPTPARAW